jgi:hypothetical protein
MTNTLEQLKFDNFIKANQAKIIKTSEQMDDKLQEALDILAPMNQLKCYIENANTDVRRAFDAGAKAPLTEAFAYLQKLETLTNTKEYTDAVKAIKALETLIKKTKDLS